MKVLWFTNTASLYDYGHHNYHGGGWIESLEELLRKRDEIELAVSFFHPTDNEKLKINSGLYYPIKLSRGRYNPFKALHNNWKSKLENEEYQNRFLTIIEDFEPDVIQVFGTEGPFGLIQNLTNIPVIVHIQGLINPYFNAYYPIGYSKFDFIFNWNFLLKNLIGLSPLFGFYRFKHQALREKTILKSIKYVCGRTEWDRSVVRIFNPDIKYFHIDEVLRPVFYERATEQKKKETVKIQILSTLSPTIYKGLDVVLKTAKQLTHLSNIEFDWKIIGLKNSSEMLKFFEKKENASHELLNIKLLGKMSPEQIINEMYNSDIFVHPSYIDNSPNSICEAQILGLPVIASNVGGVSTIIRHEQTGFLVPSNGVFEIVRYIVELSNDEEFRNRIGQEAKKVAISRHNRDKIINDLLAVYSKLIN